MEESSRPASDTDAAPVASANPNYALSQLARVLATAQAHPDADTRTRGERKVGDWLRVLGGMISGALNIGSRTPVQAYPAWITLQVLKGGFATGDALAGGPLQPHEAVLLSQGPGRAAGRERRVLNHYYLTEEGLALLGEMLATGAYRINVPEEGALLAVAYLALNGHPEKAWEVLHEITPHFDALRFYPLPASPQPATEHVRLLSVGGVAHVLGRARTPAAILTDEEAMTVWLPLADEVVALFMETVEGPVPTLVSQDVQGRSVVAGGWPCQQYPDGWADRAQAVLDKHEALKQAHLHPSRTHNPGSSAARLRAVLAVAAQDPSRLTGRDVGIVRTTLAQIRAKRGLPGSEELARLRSEQQAQAQLPRKEDWAMLLGHRLAEANPFGNLTAGLGLTGSDLERLMAPVDYGDAMRWGIAEGSSVPEAYLPLLRRATNAPLEQHLAWGTISSGEVLAAVVPHLSAQVRAAAFADPDLQRLYEQLYTAFRRRRSTLLLNLQSQVKLHELPWVAALDVYRGDESQVRGTARSLLSRIITVALSAFPHQILPNKLLQEIRALAVSSGLTLPLVDEVAADIFMGTFTEKYLRAAQEAGRQLKDTLYARYYGIDYSYVLGLDDLTPSRYGPSTSPAFDELCRMRARVTRQGQWLSPAEGGAIIEQEQILTTHNLAALYRALDLHDALGPRLSAFAQQVFKWICEEVGGLRGPRWGQLRSIKNAAYAWRQMVFFLSAAGDDAAEFGAWMSDDLAARPEGVQAQLGPFVSSLIHAAESPSPPSQESVFYGWQAHTHEALLVS